MCFENSTSVPSSRMLQTWLSGVTNFSILEMELDEFWWILTIEIGNAAKWAFRCWILCCWYNRERSVWSQIGRVFDFDELVKNKVSANIGRTPKPPGNSCIGSIALSRKYPIKELPGPERWSHCLIMRHIRSFSMWVYDRCTYLYHFLFSGAERLLTAWLIADIFQPSLRTKNTKQRVALTRYRFHFSSGSKLSDTIHELAMQL